MLFFYTVHSAFVEFLGAMYFNMLYYYIFMMTINDNFLAHLVSKACFCSGKKVM